MYRRIQYHGGLGLPRGRPESTRVVQSKSSPASGFEPECTCCISSGKSLQPIFLGLKCIQGKFIDRVDQ